MASVDLRHLGESVGFAYEGRLHHLPLVLGRVDGLLPFLLQWRRERESVVEM